jgi:hypothetical protein
MPGTSLYHFVVENHWYLIVNTDTYSIYRLCRIMRMLVDMGPLRPLSEVGIIFGDGIFAGEGLLDILNIKSTCKICLDVFHLTSDTDGAWPKEFGKAWPKLKDDFNELVYSETKAIYKVRHEALKERVAKENNPTWNEYLENNVHGHRHQLFSGSH